MIVRNLSEAANSDRKVVSPGGQWESVRLLLKEDEVGFSFHITTIKKDAELEMQYKNHFESVYCIRGVGEIESLENGEKFSITPGVVYILDRHDRHILRAFEELELACVFNPPLNGKEVHNPDGSYDLEG